MKVITSEEYLKKMADTRARITTEKLPKYNEFKDKFVKVFNEAAEEAALKLEEEFEVEFTCKMNTAPYINMFCNEIKTSFEKVEMYYDDGDEEEDDSRNRNKSKKSSDNVGSFVIVFAVIDPEQKKD